MRTKIAAVALMSLTLTAMAQGASAQAIDAAQLEKTDMAGLLGRLQLEAAKAPAVQGGRSVDRGLLPTKVNVLDFLIKEPAKKLYEAMTQIPVQSGDSHNSRSEYKKEGKNLSCLRTLDSNRLPPFDDFFECKLAFEVNEQGRVDPDLAGEAIVTSFTENLYNSASHIFQVMDGSLARTNSERVVIKDGRDVACTETMSWDMEDQEYQAMYKCSMTFNITGSGALVSRP